MLPDGRADAQREWKRLEDDRRLHSHAFAVDPDRDGRCRIDVEGGRRPFQHAVRSGPGDGDDAEDACVERSPRPIPRPRPGPVGVVGNEGRRRS